MTGQGSLANPVALDPFQNIIEVGWDPGKYLAFSLFILRVATEDFPQQPNLGGGHPFAYPWNWETTEADGLPSGDDGTRSPYSVVGFRYVLDGGAAGGSIWHKGHGWFGAPVDAVDGLPTFPYIVTLDAWQYVGDFTVGPPLASFYPQAEWIAPTGGEFVDPDGETITVPDTAFPDLRFSLASTATIQMRGTAFAGGPDGTEGLGSYFSSITDTPDGPVGATASRFNELGPRGTLNAATFAALSISLSSMTLTAGRHTWRPIAFVPTGPNDPLHDGEILDPGKLWVLCEHDDVTA